MGEAGDRGPKRFNAPWKDLERQAWIASVTFVEEKAWTVLEPLYGAMEVATFSYVVSTVGSPKGSGAGLGPDARSGQRGAGRLLAASARSYP